MGEGDAAANEDGPATREAVEPAMRSKFCHGVSDPPKTAREVRVPEPDFADEDGSLVGVMTGPSAAAGSGRRAGEACPEEGGVAREGVCCAGGLRIEGDDGEALGCTDRRRGTGGVDAAFCSD